MKYYGNPNTLIRMIYRVGIERKSKPIGRFNEQGIFETEDKKIINRMNKYFEVKVENIVQEDAQNIIQEEPIEQDVTQTTIRHCKKCDFTCETQGQLLKHYREEHKKGEGDVTEPTA